MTRAVLALTGVAVVARLVGLAGRTAHWDEGRVAYWVLRSVESGLWSYRPIIHGPFVQHVAGVLFPLLSPSDFAMRLPVALVGGLLPLVALCFRTRLDDRETTALAAFLAVNPLLLYYSRFFRSDVPLAAFAFVAFAAFLRAFDTGRRRWAFAGVLALSLAATTKENVALYPLCWAGAGALVAAGHLYVAGDRRATLRRWTDRALTGARRFALPVAAGVIVGFAVVVFFYAPRTPDPNGLGLWNALGSPGMLPALVERATLGTVEKVSSVWLSPSMRHDSYPLFLGHFVLVMLVGGGVLVSLGVLGAWIGRRRSLVAFCALWAGASVVGYPYAGDIKAPWLVVHAFVPLAVPAAVGLAAVWAEARTALETSDRRRALVFCGLLVLAGAHVGIVGALTNHAPTDEQNLVAQGGQPSSNLHPTVRDIAAVSDTTDGTDLGYYGSLAVDDEARNDDPPAASNWYSRLPFPWYTEAHDVTVGSVTRSDLRDSPPPVVVTTDEEAAAVAPLLDGYERRERAMLLHGNETTYRVFGYERRVSGQSFVFFLRAE